jgi:hypothetical protein
LQKNVLSNFRFLIFHWVYGDVPSFSNRRQFAAQLSRPFVQWQHTWWLFHCCGYLWILIFGLLNEIYCERKYLFELFFSVFFITSLNVNLLPTTHTHTHKTYINSKEIQIVINFGASSASILPILYAARGFHKSWLPFQRQWKKMNAKLSSFGWNGKDGPGWRKKKYYSRYQR